MTRLMIFASLLGLLSACSSFKQQNELARFDGAFYRAAVASTRGAETTAPFTVTVRDAAQGLAGAREAGRYEAIQHCIKQTASSEIEWITGPDSPDSALTISDGSLILQGRCVDPR